MFIFDMTNGWTLDNDIQLDRLVEHLYHKYFKTMIITHQTDVVKPASTIIMCHLALNKEIQDFLAKHRLTQTFYYVNSSTLYLYIHLNDGSCVIVKY
jgi:hypothetical protein